eukprot:496770_1
MDNNEYIPYCEACLVSRNIQKNTTKIQKLQKKLQSHNNKFINAQKIRDIAKLINEFETDVKRLKNCKNDKTIIYDIQNEIQNFCNKVNIKCDKNIVQDFVAKYNICDEQKFSQQIKMNKNCTPICKCGTEMLVIKESKCYESNLEYSYVICDICQTKIKSKQTVYHCPKKKLDNIHPDGFDICKFCRKKYVHRLRYFVALIICPNMTDNNGKIKLNDNEKLIAMFKKLGFHKIICLNGDDVTKESVENAINDILPSNSKNNKKNINQFTAICYSGHGAIIPDDIDDNGDIGESTYYFALDHNEPSTWVSSEIIKNQCQAANDGAVLDGIKHKWNEIWNGTYYRHNTLLLVNSCHSGGADKVINAQNIADAFSMRMGIILAAVGLGAVSLRTLYEIGKHCDSVTVSRLMSDLGLRSGPLLVSGPQTMSSEFVVGVAIAAGIGIISAIIMILSVRKSMKYESMTLIASCDKIEDSNTFYPTSPFIKYVTEFFDMFLNGDNNDMLGELKIDCDSPAMLYKYLQQRYGATMDNGASLCSLNQNTRLSYRGFQQFAMCPIFNQ